LRILLDTHVWLWSFREPQRIGPVLKRYLRDSKNELWLSPVSTWEALVLHRKGRLAVHQPTADWIAALTAPFREAPVTHEIAVTAENLSFQHRDPVDRFLAATAKVLGLTLATADTKLLGLGDIATLANR
jgi:PIN domain nuclease of toxin-antitoxin system